VFERRKGKRRQGERRDAARAVTGRRASDRREKDRRYGFRLAYPIGAAPEIVNIRSQVIGLTAKAVRFFISDFNLQGLSLKQGDKIDIALRFHDGQVIKTTGTISRREQYQAGREYFICLFEQDLPQERLDKEQTYLLENFPDFCKGS
jgi:hypothetical protein